MRLSGLHHHPPLQGDRWPDNTGRQYSEGDPARRRIAFLRVGDAMVLRTDTIPGLPQPAPPTTGVWGAPRRRQAERLNSNPAGPLADLLAANKAPPPQRTYEQRLRAYQRTYDNPAPGTPLIPGTAWPDLVNAGLTYKQSLAALTQRVGRWTASVDYTLSDGRPRRFYRQYPAGDLKTFPHPPHPNPEHHDHRRTLRGLQPRFWQNPGAGAFAPIVLVEGEQDAAALVAARVPYRIASSWATSSANTIDLTPLLGQDVLILPDFDGPGYAAADTLQARLFAAGTKARIVKGHPAAAIASGLPRDGGDGKNPFHGIGAADLLPEALHKMLAPPAPAPIPVKDVDRPIRPQEMLCLAPGRSGMKQNTAKGDLIWTPFDCRTCSACVSWQQHQDRLRYGHGLPNTDQTIIKADFPTRAAAVAFRSHHRQRIKDRRAYWEQHSELPSVGVLNYDGVYHLAVIYPSPIPDAEKRIARKSAFKYGAKAEIVDQRLPSQDFAAMLPAYRRWYGEDDQPAADAVTFSKDWPARWRIPDPLYDGNDGYIEKPVLPRPEPDIPDYVQAWRTNPTDETRCEIAQEWLTDTRPVPHDLATEWFRAVSDKESTAALKAIIRRIRAATGYAGHSGMLKRAVTHNSPRDRLVREWLFSIQHGRCLTCQQRERAPAAFHCLTCDPTAIDRPAPGALESVAPVPEAPTPLPDDTDSYEGVVDHDYNFVVPPSGYAVGDQAPQDFLIYKVQPLTMRKATLLPRRKGRLAQAPPVAN